ncbi:MAG TPA: alkaline phosphatase family protein [Gaiellaceae bacterium]|nr:alkaline phosphatase family protein [Gaiellaceae bacterium]
MLRKRALLGLLLIGSLAVVSVVGADVSGGAHTRAVATGGATKTPIKHLVVIYQENVSFDHYFGTYPKAANTDGSPFIAAPNTPAVNGLLPATASSIPASLQHTNSLTAQNPNSAPPVRMDATATGNAWNISGQLTCDQDHNYSDEEKSFDGGAMDQFVQAVGQGNGSAPFGELCRASTVMDYYDGNTVTGFWNYAQHYAMSDNSFDTEFGPSAPGAIDLASGDTGNVDTKNEAGNVTIATSAAPNADITADGTGGYSLTSDAQPFYDDCSTRDAVALKGQNIGDLLNQAGLSWGWFQGGFDPTTTYTAGLASIGKTGQPDSTFIPDEFATAGFQSSVAHSSNQALCNAVHPVGVALGGTGQWGYKDDYIAHHEPFQFYASTANPHHLTISDSALTGPGSLSTIGKDTQTFTGGYGVGPQFNTPNHNYDTADFDQLVSAITSGALPASALPAVTFLKAPGYQDGHAAYSEPADEQAFVVKEINALMKTPDWSSTAVIINYDDSDGWYDHVYPGIQNTSASVADNLTKTVTGTISASNPTSGLCGSSSSAPLGGQQGRCGFSSRLPMMVISPCAKQNYVDHNLSDQSSIINFVEYNWGLSSISGSFDQALAATDKKEGIPFDLAGMFDFTKCTAPAEQLDPASGRVDLRSANLKGKNLKGQNFATALMSKANLAGANLAGGFLPAADLENATLTGANLKGANLRGADLTGANLSGANLSKAKLSGAKLSGATWTNATCPNGSKAGSSGCTA